MNATIDNDGIQQYLTFRVAEEEYAVDILHVREIIEFSSSTRVPGTPGWIHGVINLRGRVVPVVDLSVRFGLGPTQVTPWTCAVIVEIVSEEAPLVMGLLADSVSQVLEISAAAIEPPPSFGTAVRADYLLGVARADGQLVLVLDIDHLLTNRENDVLAVTTGAEMATAAAG
jgi:purine-binding chemotaxis protein CheW